MKIEKNCALLVIDIQQEDFMEMNESNIDEPRWNVIRNGKRVLDVFRTKKLPVIQIKECHRPDMACIEREIYEETSIHTCVEHLAVVCENFFKGIGGTINGLDCHTIEFYYYMKILDEDLKSCKSETDEGEELVWLSLEEIALKEIKPTFIKENINNIMNEKKIIHIIEERDR